MDKKYSIGEINKAWKAYNNTNVLRVMRGGKYHYVELKGKGIPRIEGTQANIVKLSQIKPFPEFLSGN
jgi:hypothetical protein